LLAEFFTQGLGSTGVKLKLSRRLEERFS